MTTQTLDARQAAQLLHIHPQTLMSLARAGVIPGCRIGKAWVFVESLLIEYLVAQSLSRVSVAGTQEKTECRSTEEKTRPIGGRNSRPSVANLARYPASIQTAAQRALFNNVSRHESLALALDAAVLVSLQDDWRNNAAKTKRVRNAIRHVLSTDLPANQWLNAQDGDAGIALTGDLDHEADRILELVKNQHGY
jgi:type I restriction enzyme R subunit